MPCPSPGYHSFPSFFLWDSLADVDGQVASEDSQPASGKILYHASSGSWNSEFEQFGKLSLSTLSVPGMGRQGSRFSCERDSVTISESSGRKS